MMRSQELQQERQGLWEQAIPGNINKANGNWPAVLAK
jgi:hypothetical protein